METTLLPAVDRVVGRIEIENEHPGLVVDALEKDVHEQRIDRREAERDRPVPIVGTRVLAAQREAMEGVPARKRAAAVTDARTSRSAHVALADESGEEGVAAQLVVVDASS